MQEAWVRSLDREDPLEIIANPALAVLSSPLSRISTFNRSTPSDGDATLGSQSTLHTSLLSVYNAPIHLFIYYFIYPFIGFHLFICHLFIYALIHLYIPSFISILHLFIYLFLPHVLLTWAKQILYHVLKQPCPKELCVRAQLLQCSPTLCNTMDCSPPGSSVHVILSLLGRL